MVTRRDFLAHLPIGVFVGAETLRAATSAVAAADRPLTIAYPVDVPTWEPTANGSTVVTPIHKCVFEQPLNLAPDLTFGPSVVKGYRWLDEAGTALELTLRDGVTFQNGDPLTSDDFKFTYFDHLQADKTLMLGFVWSSMIAGIDTPSPSVAVIRLNAPYPNAPQQLASTASFVLPRKYFERTGSGFADKPIGAGPYRLVDYQRDSRIVLEAYDKYWQGPAKIRQVVFQVIKDEQARVAAVQAGAVDVAINLPVREVARLDKVPGLVGVAHPINSVVLIQMVNKGVFRDPNLRLAMHHAIDKRALSRAFFNDRAEVLSMWSGKNAPANDPNFVFSYDPELAKQLLAKSGYGPDKPAKIQFSTFKGVFSSDFDLARAIVQMWKQVAIDADLHVLELANYNELSRNDKLEAPVLYSWTNPTGDPAVYSGTILDPRKRFAVWKSDDIVPRLDPLLKEIDYDKRIAGYREFDKWAVEQGYAFPMLQSTATLAHSKAVHYTPFKNGWPLPYFWTLG